MKPIVFFVDDNPMPGGSKVGFIDPQTGAVVVKEACAGNAGWRLSVQYAARLATGPMRLLEWPLRVEMVFYRTRPKGHYGTGRNAGVVKPSAPKYPTGRPDVLKLARSTEDALTGVIWRDDSATCDLILRKRYGDRPGAMITISIMR